MVRRCEWDHCWFRNVEFLYGRGRGRYFQHFWCCWCCKDADFILLPIGEYCRRRQPPRTSMVAPTTMPGILRLGTETTLVAAIWKDDIPSFLYRRYLLLIKQLYCAPYYFRYGGVRSRCIFLFGDVICCCMFYGSSESDVGRKFRKILF